MFDETYGRFERAAILSSGYFVHGLGQDDVEYLLADGQVNLPVTALGRL
jgi:hypothetical protein